MADHNIFLGKTVSTSLLKGMMEIKPGTASPLTVNFEGGGKALLDPADPRAAVWARRIDYLQKHNRPVYVQTDAQTNTITFTATPEATVALSIDKTTQDETVAVGFKTLAALFTLRRDHPNSREMLRLLELSLEKNSPLLVTFTSDYEIIDVRTLPAAYSNPELLKQLSAPLTSEEKSEDTPPLTEAKALELFKFLQTQSCSPCESTGTCIPFMYPRDGCWIRAHLMCYRLVALGVTPQKIWIIGSLDTDTPNDAACKVHWIYHVAPMFMVEQKDGVPVQMAFDPSMCNTPVPVEKWRALQTDPKSIVLTSRWEQYKRFGSETATEEAAEDAMETYRIALDAACTEKKGPPPYAWCKRPEA